MKQAKKWYTYYDADGYPRQQRECRDPAADTDGYAWVEGQCDYNLDYVDTSGPTPVIRPRQDYDLQSIPTPCTVEIEGIQYECPAGAPPAFDFNYTDAYKVKINAGSAYLEKEFTV